MPKYSIGASVRIKNKELSISLSGGYGSCQSGCIVRIPSGKSCKVTGSVVIGSDTYYFIDVKLGGGITVNTRVKEDEIELYRGISFGSDDFKDSFLEYFKSNLLGTDFGDPDAWFKSFLDIPTPVVVDPNRYYIGTYETCQPSKGSEKMPVKRCIEILESYSVERDELKRGVDLDLRIRDSLVDEALGRAIELLNGGAE